MALSKRQIASLVYHDQYGYPMTKRELARWQLPITKFKSTNIKYECKAGYCFLRGRGKLVALRLKRTKASTEKLQLLQKYLPIFAKIPTILFVGVTGSLAMHNADPESDIDLMMITKNNTLWFTRGILMCLLIFLRIPSRRAGNKQEKNKLCLNLWLDETALVWPVTNRNIYTAHEIAQVIPMVNKQQTFEKFISSNLWIKKWWPNAIKTRNSKLETRKELSDFVFSALNFCAYRAQLWYMKPKMTNEVVSIHRALFHPKIFSNRS